MVTQRTNIITASGDLVNITGSVVLQSGTGVTIPVPMAVRVRPTMRVPDLSGGVVLVSGAVTEVRIKSLDGDVYVGGVSSSDMPYSGFGIMISQFDSLSFNIANFNLVKVYAITSGNRISYGGVD